MSHDEYIPEDIAKLYEVHDYKHAAAIICNEFPEEFGQLCSVLRRFRLTEGDILSAGGSESNIPKRFSSLLRPLGWEERQLNGRMIADDEEVSSDTHMIDYLKGRIAFDLEWNSKDQTFDRDLYAFRAFFEYNRISAGVLVTRSNDLNEVFKRLDVRGKYGASTTHMGKLLPRLRAGRSGGCPVLVFGITTRLIEPQQ